MSKYEGDDGSDDRSYDDARNAVHPFCGLGLDFLHIIRQRINLLFRLLLRRCKQLDGGSEFVNGFGELASSCRVSAK